MSNAERQQAQVIKLYWIYRKNGSTPARAWEAAMLSVAIGMTLD